MASGTRRFCAHCGKHFKVCAYNAHHQKFCLRERCVRDRKRERQRESYNRRYSRDPSFREAERKRAREGIRRRRQAKAPPTDASVLLFDSQDVVAGLVSQLADIADPVELQQAIHGYARRGRRLTLQHPVGARGG